MIHADGLTSIGGDLIVNSARFGELTAGTTVIAEISTDRNLTVDSAIPTQKACKSYMDAKNDSILMNSWVHTESVVIRQFGPTVFTGVGPNDGITIGGLLENQLILTHNNGEFDFTATKPGTVRDDPPLRMAHAVCSNVCTFTDIVAPMPGIGAMLYEVPMRIYACPGVVDAVPTTIGAYAGYRFPGTSNATMFLSCLSPLSTELGVGLTKPQIIVKLRVGSAAATASAQFAFRYKCVQNGEPIVTEAVALRNVSAIPGKMVNVVPTIPVTTRGPGAVVMVAMTRNGATDASLADIYVISAVALFRMTTWGARPEDL